MRTSNPFLKEDTFSRHAYLTGEDPATLMTVKGTANKCLIMLALAMVTFGLTWYGVEQRGPQAIFPYIIGSALGGLVLALIIAFKAHLAPVLAPVYALVKGIVLGGLSAVLEIKFPGIAFQAVGITMGVFLTMLVVYRSGLITVTRQFMIGVVAATGGIALIYLVSIIASWGFGYHIPFIHEGGPIGIGFSLFVMVIAALNLVLDFHFIEKGVEQGAPKEMEWYGAFGLMVTLFWLYIEALRLLAKLRR
ncbi:MAG TPA: Bax inhibitor-1/YccA family protein [Fimbriimonadaceae bacterium]|nr:Bax inhibitor-1/YccA family protein [Fimbriimonadaceae bacterium]